MHSHLKIFFSIALLSIYSAAIPTSGALASAAAGTSSGTFSVSSTSYGALQNIGSKIIWVNRTGGSGAANVLCSTRNNTAVSGVHYTAENLLLRWASGDMTPKTCVVPISNAKPFSGQKTFYVSLSNPAGGALGTPSTATVTIYGDEAVGRVALASPTYTVAQSAGSLAISVNRTGGSSGWAAVGYATANGTAMAGTHYSPLRGVVSWAHGDTAPKTIMIPINKSQPFTGAKTLVVAIAGAQGALMGTVTSSVVTINGGTAPATGTATLSWTAPTLNTNGLPITDLAGYNLYYGQSSTALTHVIAVNNPAAGSYEIRNLAPGTWYFAVVAYNTQARESAPSAIVSKPI